MSKHSMLPKKRHRGGKFLLALCNLLGTLILLATIVSCSLLVIPQIKGYSVYHVVSGSMEPEIPVGSIVYVETTAPEEIQAKDIIAFQSGDSVITHRVVRNHIVEGEFTTKGDNNPVEDEDRVDYAALIGKVVRHYPYMGEALELYSTGIGKIYIILFAACGAMLNILAARFRARLKEQEQAAEEAEQKSKPDAPESPAE